MLGSNVWNWCGICIRELLSSSIGRREDEVLDVVLETGFDETIGLGFLCTCGAVNCNAEDSIDWVRRVFEDGVGSCWIAGERLDSGVQGCEGFGFGRGGIASEGEDVSIRGKGWVCEKSFDDGTALCASSTNDKEGFGGHLADGRY